jgi:hypothetical protein
MIIDFSSLGSGTGKQVDLCDQCRYFIKISMRDSVPKAAWHTGEQIKGGFSHKDVKITISGIKRCKRHGGGLKNGNADRKPKPAFLEAAIRSGIDINESLDDYRSDILKQRQPKNERET